ncbi:MAG TPA: sortase [Candidatus Sulfotelmatobacter sp.]|nr:sortase [Candidatus Sulfotelmatobacter sp.]
MPKKKKLPSSKRVKKIKKKSLKNNLLLQKFIGLIFISLALFLLIFPIHLPTKKPSTKNPIVINSKLLSSVKKETDPLRILIPKRDIDLPIIDAKVVDGYWELSETTASYGLGSGHPGQKGNTVIFAHARQGLFYNLKDVVLGDTIYVFTKDKWYRYKVSKITAVYPNQTDIIAPTKTEVLTLYTCTGFNDEKRLIVQAVPQN